MAEKLRLRSELPVEETWDLTLLFENQTQFNAAVNRLRMTCDKFRAQYISRLADQDMLISALKDLAELTELENKVFQYANLAYETDKSDPTVEENALKMQPIAELLGSKLAFFKSELASLPDAYLSAVAQSEAGAPYASFLQAVIRDKKHMLSPEVEETLSALSGSIHNQYSLYGSLKFQDLTFADFEADGQTYHNSFVAFEGEFEGHDNRQIRLAAWDSFHQGLAKYQHTAASNYINAVQTDRKLAKLRGFESTIDYLLYSQQVDQIAYHRQIDVIMSEFAPVMRRYAKILAKARGLERMTLADIKIALSAEPAQAISIKESANMIKDAFQVLGEGYSQIVDEALSQRWIDYPMNQTKSTGGFCSTVYNGPSYILLNWTGLLSEVLVLAHELGHACHFQLTYQNQSILTPETSLYFIEAPSTANEVIMCQYLLNQPLQAQEKRNLIGEFISRTYFHNMVTHLLEAHWQRKVYQAIDNEETLNAAKLNQFYRETLTEFWGDAVEVNEGAELTWMRQPHYFMGLYSYTYSAGLTIGTAIGQRIAQGEADAITNWLTVLKAGGTLDAISLAQVAGVNMQDATALRQAIAYVDGLLDQIEAD